MTWRNVHEVAMHSRTQSEQPFGASVTHGATAYVTAVQQASAAALVATWLTGCASFSPDAGMDAVSGIAAAELKKQAYKTDNEEAANAAERRVRQLLASPLSADAAVQIALLNNKGLQAAYNDLGVAEAAKVEASLPPNPAFSASSL